MRKGASYPSSTEHDILLEWGNSDKLVKEHRAEKDPQETFAVHAHSARRFEMI